MWSKSIRILNPYEATKESPVQSNAQIVEKASSTKERTQYKKGSQ